jgi:HSP20 family protein
MTDRPREWRPVADLLETPSEYRVCINLPGLRRDEISIVMPDDRTLTIRGRYDSAPRDEGATYLSVERPRVPVEKTIHLSAAALSDQVEASLDLGVLTIRLPKRHPQTHGPRQVPIR